MRLYLDTNFVIYCVEGNPGVRNYCLDRLRRLVSLPSAQLITSRLTRVEAVVKPLRLRDVPRFEEFRGFFEDNNVNLIDVSNTIVDRAQDIRVGSTLKLVDALHVATAVEHEADLFLTADGGILALGQMGSVTFERIPVP